MLAQGSGRIVFITSIAGHTAVPGAVAYASAKSGIAGLTRQVGVEWAGRGVRVNTVAPGLTMTPDARANADFSTAGFIPNGRAAEPGEIADLAVFLLPPRPRRSPARRSSSTAGPA